MKQVRVAPATRGAKASKQYLGLRHSRRSLIPATLQPLVGNQIPDLDHFRFLPQIIDMPVKPLTAPEVPPESGGEPSQRAAHIEVVAGREGAVG